MIEHRNHNLFELCLTNNKFNICFLKCEQILEEFRGGRKTNKIFYWLLQLRIKILFLYQYILFVTMSRGVTKYKILLEID